MFVRRAVAADIPSLLPLCRAFHAESPVHRVLPFDDDTVTLLVSKAVDDPNWLALVAIDDTDEIVGMSLHYCMGSWFSKALEVGDLTFYVRPDKRGGRAAHMMLKKILAWFEASGAARIQQGITTGINDDAAARFFGKFGFKPSGVLLQRADTPAPCR